MSHFQRFIRTIRHMVGPYRPLKRPEFPFDRDLELRLAMQRDMIGHRDPVPDRKLVEEQPETWKRFPIDYDKGLPNG